MGLFGSLSKILGKVKDGIDSAKDMMDDWVPDMEDFGFKEMFDELATTVNSSDSIVGNITNQVQTNISAISNEIDTVRSQGQTITQPANSIVSTANSVAAQAQSTMQQGVNVVNQAIAYSQQAQAAAQSNVAQSQLFQTQAIALLQLAGVDTSAIPPIPDAPVLQTAPLPNIPIPDIQPIPTIPPAQ